MASIKGKIGYWNIYGKHFLKNLIQLAKKLFMVIERPAELFRNRETGEERSSFCLQWCADQYTLFCVLFHLCKSSLWNIPSSLLCCELFLLQNTENSASSLSSTAQKTSTFHFTLPRPRLMKACHVLAEVICCSSLLGFT